MSELPWPDGTFDVVMSFNGILAGVDAAVAEVRRMLRPGGRVVVSFWGKPANMELLASWGVAVGELAPPADVANAIALLEIGRPGVAESMLDKAVFTVTGRETVPASMEFADIDMAVRALSSARPSWAAIQHSGLERWEARLREVLVPFTFDNGIVRLRNEGPS